MYSKRHNLTIGFHGCDSKTRDFVINGGNLNPNCIKGYFIPREIDKSFSIP